MNADEMMFFDRMPQMLPIYETLRNRLVEKYADIQIKVSKTQISFGNRHIFAMVSLPFRRTKNISEVCMLVSFGLSYRLDSSRIFQAVEPYPNRWTHHVLIENRENVDTQLIEWLDAAYQFSIIK
jgi:hypothetical protein